MVFVGTIVTRHSFVNGPRLGLKGDVHVFFIAVLLKLNLRKKILQVVTVFSHCVACFSAVYG